MQDKSGAQRWASYAEMLVKESDGKLQRGELKAAIEGYLKCADIFLMLAKHEESYSKWQQYIDKANLCHQKVKQLIR